MPRDGAIIFGDLIGKLDMLRVECRNAGAQAGTGTTPWRSVGTSEAMAPEP